MKLKLILIIIISITILSVSLFIILNESVHLEVTKLSCTEFMDVMYAKNIEWHEEYDIRYEECLQETRTKTLQNISEYCECHKSGNECEPKNFTWSNSTHYIDSKTCEWEDGS